MKIIVKCHQCGPKEEAALLEIGNENLHQVICDKGHESSLIIAQQKHEILFEIAIHAIIDGYYREAISSFAASLERYYEFFINVISVDVSSKEFKKAWKQVSSQSERQLGSYIFTYLNAFRTSPNTLPQPLTTLRNNVIHKGHIPSREDAIKFGKAVAEIIYDGCDLLYQKNHAQLHEVIRQALYPNNQAGSPILSLSTYLNCLNNSGLDSFEGYLEEVQTHNKSRF